MKAAHQLRLLSNDDIIQMMDSIYLPEWTVISHTLIINDIKKFAIDMLLFSSDNHLNGLEHWSDSLRMSCLDFDIINIVSMMESFPALVSELSNKQND